MCSKITKKVLMVGGPEDKNILEVPFDRPRNFIPQVPPTPVANTIHDFKQISSPLIKNHIYTVEEIRGKNTSFFIGLHAGTDIDVFITKALEAYRHDG